MVLLRPLALLLALVVSGEELVGGGTQMLVKGYKLSGLRGTNSEDLVYNLVARVNNAELYTSNLLKEYILSILQTHTQR